MIFKSFFIVAVYLLCITEDASARPASAGSSKVQVKCTCQQQVRSAVAVPDSHHSINSYPPFSGFDLLLISSLMNYVIRYLPSYPCSHHQSLCCCLEFPTQTSGHHSKQQASKSTVTCHSGTDFSTCCGAKNPTAAKCKGSMIASKPATRSPELGGTASSWGPAPMNACDDQCNATASGGGSTCVYLSGGLIRTPSCTCNNNDDCGSGGSCSVENPNLKNNYHGNTCHY